MKRILITLALVLSLSLIGCAATLTPTPTLTQGGGMFQRGEKVEMVEDAKVPGVPGHGHNGNQDAPIGEGVAVLTALGTAYLIGKKRNSK
jgi:hypothetical protein